MHSQDEESPLQQALMQCLGSSTNISLMYESLLLLSRKRQTLEEKAIGNQFHRLIGAYSRLIALLHTHMSSNSYPDEAQLVTLHKLRTVNEKVRSCVESLLKIVKYDLNFLEQYFEYEFCSNLLDKETFLPDLETVVAELESTLVPASN